MPSAYIREQLVEAAAVSVSWNDMMRRLGFAISGGRRRSLQHAVTELGIDVEHFKHRSPWVKYSDEAISAAVATSTTLREVANKLGAVPATGTLSHIRRRIQAAGIDVGHFPNMDRTLIDLPFDREELSDAAMASKSIRDMARRLGVGDDKATRAAMRRALSSLDIDVSHFSHARIAIPETKLRASVPRCTSFADVMRDLGLQVTFANHRKVSRRTKELGLDTSHFVRRQKAVTPSARPRKIPPDVFHILPEASPRTSRDRLHRALQAAGVPYSCASCGNTGAWRGSPITLQIDHIDGNWRNNRRDNLRYLCPNCHAITESWCRQKRSRARRRTGQVPGEAASAERRWPPTAGSEVPLPAADPVA